MEKADMSKYKIVLGPEGCNPCELCDVKNFCHSEDDEYSDYLMLCGCEFCTKPYYIKKI